MWNYYYNFDGEIQLADWKICKNNPDGSLLIVCETELEKDADKILLWSKNPPGRSGNARVLEINGIPVREKTGFYIGNHAERQGIRLSFHAGKNRIEVVVMPGSGEIGNFRMQLIDILPPVELKEYFCELPEQEREVFSEVSPISSGNMMPGAGHKPYPGRFGFVKGTGLLDCSMHAFGKISKMYLCGDPETKVPWAWGYSLIQEESTDTAEGAAGEKYDVSPLALRWKRNNTEYLCSTAYPGIVTKCPNQPFLKVSELTFAGNYQYILTSGEVASTGRFSGNMPENWLLLFGSTEYPDLPLLLIADCQPEKVEFLRNSENRLTEVRLYGCSRLTTLTPFGFEPLAPCLPTDEKFLADAVLRCRFWAGASLAIPTVCREYYCNDHEKQEVRIVQKFEYEEFTDSRNTAALYLAPLPPAAGLDRESVTASGAMDFRFPTKYGPMSGWIGRNSEYTLKMVYPYRKFPLKQDDSQAEKLLLQDLENYFEFQSRFPDNVRSYAYSGAILEGYAFTGTLFNFMPEKKRDLLAKILPRRMELACDPDGKYTSLLTEWGHLFRTSPERDETEKYYKGKSIKQMEMYNFYERKEPFSGVEYILSYLNCSMLFSGELKTGTREEVLNYPVPCIENDWGAGIFLYMLYLSSLISGDYSAARKNWDVLKKIFSYFEYYHDWACMGAGYAEKACTWVEGAGFGAFTAYTNLARAAGDQEAAEQAVYLTAKLLVLDKVRFLAGPYFANLYHVEPWYGCLFFQEEYDLYRNFQSVPKEAALSPRERIRRGSLHAFVTEGLYPELFDASRTSSPEAHRKIMDHFREAYGGGFDAEKPPQGRLQCDFSYLLVNDVLDPSVPPEQTKKLIGQAKACRKLMEQWHDVHRFENNTPADYLASQLTAWLEMREHPLWLEHWEDVRIHSAQWHQDSKVAEIEIEITGKNPFIRCGMRKVPGSVLLSGNIQAWENLKEKNLIIRPSVSGHLNIIF